MFRKVCLFGAIFFLISGLSKAQMTSEIAIVPQPLKVEKQSGNFKLTPSTKIVVEPGNTAFRKIAEMMAAAIKEESGINPAITTGSAVGNNQIFISSKNTIDSLGKEGYELSVTNQGIRIKAREGNGAFYAMQTFLQLLPVDLKSGAKTGISVPAIKIIDKPRFEWRGLMLDVGRYYYSMDFLKKYIDYLALHKMNVFHWHLTEDHGWRLEIKSHPRLTQVAAWRETNQFDRTQLDNTPKGGYYTQEQAKELVAYAADRYVTIIPEIEMPGHSLSSLVTYPELSCTGGPFQMPGKWGIQKDIFCAGNDKTFKFLEDVLSEVAAIFPSPIIHIGGDEAPKDRWKTCPKCQERMKKEGLKDEHELQSYFIKRIENFLLTKNKNIIGWDEILEGGLAPNATVMSWRGIKGGIEAAKQHHPVIMAPNSYYYLDYYQGKPYQEPIAINSSVLSLEKVYSFEPSAPELTAAEEKYIKGVQGNVWSEFIQSPEKVIYMAYPRAAAIAETGWSAATAKNWENFKWRMETMYQRYNKMGLGYSTSAYAVWQTATVDSIAQKAKISFRTDSYKPQIRYTTDGNEPTSKSKLYTAPFDVKLPVLIKSATFKNDKRISKITEEAVFTR